MVSKFRRLVVSAVGSPRRSASVPQAPTMSEAGEGCEAYSWAGVFAPARFGTFLRPETATWARVVKAANIRPD